MSVPPTTAPELVHLAWRRARVAEVAAELVDSARTQRRDPHPHELRQARELSAALDYLDRRIAMVKGTTSAVRTSSRRLDGHQAQIALRELADDAVPIPVARPARPRYRFDFDRPGMPAPIAPVDVLKPGGSWRRTLGALGPNERQR